MVVYGPRRRALVIPAATIERLADSLVKNGRLAHGYLGLGLWPAKVEGEDTTGNIVISVDPDGPGAAAGLHQGDMLVRWNDQPMRPIRQLMRDLGPTSVGTVVSVGVRRAGETQSVTLTIGERPDG